MRHAVSIYLFGCEFRRPEAIFLGLLDSKERRPLVLTSSNAAYAEPGYLLYLRDNKTLVAQPFDRRSYLLNGEPHTLSDEVLYTAVVDRAVFSVSSGDVLVMQTGKGASISQLTWFDRSGKPAGRIGMPGTFGNVRLSPDGQGRHRPDRPGRRSDIWVHELARKHGRKPHLTSGRWSNDADRRSFVSAYLLAYREMQGGAALEQLGSSQLAAQRGYRDGTTDGLQQRYRSGSFQANATEKYQKADRGYSVSSGDLSEYKRAYREAYCNGYQQAYYSETEKIETANITGANEPE